MLPPSQKRPAGSGGERSQGMVQRGGAAAAYVPHFPCDLARVLLGLPRRGIHTENNIAFDKTNIAYPLKHQYAYIWWPNYGMAPAHISVF